MKLKIINSRNPITPSAPFGSSQDLIRKKLRLTWFKYTNQSEVETSYLTRLRLRGPAHKHISKVEEANFRPNFSFFTILSTAKAHVCGVKFIGLYGTVRLYGTCLNNFLTHMSNISRSTWSWRQTILPVAKKKKKSYLP